MPGDSLTVRFTPPRAGTFMYHSHSNELQQIGSGMFGAIVVLEPGRKLDAEHDRVFVFGDNGPVVNVIKGPFPVMTLNGSTQPPPVELKSPIGVCAFCEISWKPAPKYPWFSDFSSAPATDGARPMDSSRTAAQRWFFTKLPPSGPRCGILPLRPR